MNGQALSHAERVAANFPADSVEHKVALYHDHLEDGLGDVPADVYDHVVVLTRDPERESYSDYIERVGQSGDPVAIAVKVADLVDNLARCDGQFDGEAKPSLRGRYERALAELMR